jgi:uncharacterized peroxidase-related enzyme
MAWIRTAPAEEMEGPLDELYRQDLDRLGFVMEATKTWSVRPELGLAYRAFEAAVMAAPGLSARERRLIHLVVAQRIRSTYCVLVYAAALERDLGGPDGIRAVLRDYRGAGLSEREVAVLDYALAVAVGHPTEADVERLRRLGLDDGAILHVAAVAALRLFGSRVYDALGVETDPFFLEQTDLAAAVSAGDVTRRA